MEARVMMGREKGFCMSRRKWWIAAAVLWMAGIFCVTQLPYFTGERTSEAIRKVVDVEREQQSMQTSSADRVDVDLLNLLIRKSTHIIAFGFLAFLLFKSLETFRFPYMLAWTLTFLYAITDEYHQSFMPGREAAFRDVLIDSFGALLVLLLTFILRKKRVGKV